MNFGGGGSERVRVGMGSRQKCAGWVGEQKLGGHMCFCVDCARFRAVFEEFSRFWMVGSDSGRCARVRIWREIMEFGGGGSGRVRVGMGSCQTCVGWVGDQKICGNMCFCGICARVSCILEDCA